MELKVSRVRYCEATFPFRPRCPRCGRANDITERIVSHYHRCEFCGKQLRTDKLSFHNEMRRLMGGIHD